MREQRRKYEVNTEREGSRETSYKLDKLYIFKQRKAEIIIQMYRNIDLSKTWTI